MVLLYLPKKLVDGLELGGSKLYWRGPPLEKRWKSGVSVSIFWYEHPFAIFNSYSSAVLSPRHSYRKYLSTSFPQQPDSLLLVWGQKSTAIGMT